MIYVYGPANMIVEQINNTAGSITYLHHDQQGSTRLITGSTGKEEGKCSWPGPRGALLHPQTRP
jgi:hypothetical protein